MRKYCPVALVVASIVIWVALLVSLTVALGTAAPDTSVTVPFTSPVAVCAKMVEGKQNVNSNRIAASRLLRILSSHCADCGPPQEAGSAPTGSDLYQRNEATS